jgi:hypothetical protein
MVPVCEAVAFGFATCAGAGAGAGAGLAARVVRLRVRMAGGPLIRRSWRRRMWQRRQVRRWQRGEWGLIVGRERGGSPATLLADGEVGGAGAKTLSRLLRRM